MVEVKSAPKPLQGAGGQARPAVKAQAKEAASAGGISLAAWAGGLMGEAKAAPAAKAPRAKSGVYLGSGGGGRVYPDGYRRKSPVQEMKLPPGYARRRARRVTGGIIGVAAALGLAAAILSAIKMA